MKKLKKKANCQNKLLRKQTTETTKTNELDIKDLLKHEASYEGEESVNNKIKVHDSDKLYQEKLLEYVKDVQIEQLYKSDCSNVESSIK